MLAISTFMGCTISKKKTDTVCHKYDDQGRLVETVTTCEESATFTTSEGYEFTATYGPDGVLATLSNGEHQCTLSDRLTPEREDEIREAFEACQCDEGASDGDKPQTDALNGREGDSTESQTCEEQVTSCRVRLERDEFDCDRLSLSTQ